MTALPKARHWIFDMDGTLTVPVHDFPAMRRELDLPEGIGMVEAIAALPEPERSERHRRLDAIGLRYAQMARAQDGTRVLLEGLLSGGNRIGLVTRNSRESTLVTLSRAGLDDLFPDETVWTRDDPPAKPAPDPVLRLLADWGAAPTDAIMVGDAVHDLRCGRDAGTAVVLVDPHSDSPLRCEADAVVTGMADLLARVEGQFA
jgi:HAD superfamily hydrolase (TIGR01509 family)